MPFTITRRRIAAAGVACTLAAAPAYALAASKNGVTPTSPRAGATIPMGKAATFKGKVRGAGIVYVYVCKSAKRSAKEGIICPSEQVAIGKATKKGGAFSYRQKVFAFDEYWLNSPGTYYWQAHRIVCEKANTSDCRQEGPVVRFKVG